MARRSTRQVVLRRLLRVTLRRFMTRRVFMYRPIVIVIRRRRTRRLIRLPITRRRILLLFTVLTRLTVSEVSISDLLVARRHRNLIDPISVRRHLLRTTRRLNYCLMVAISSFTLCGPTNRSNALTVVECHFLYFRRVSFNVVRRSRARRGFNYECQQGRVTNGNERRTLTSVLVRLRGTINGRAFLTRNGVRAQCARQYNYQLLLYLLCGLVPLFNTGRRVVVCRIMNRFVGEDLSAGP